ncbi:MAG: sulfite exporter TauE/SafE family protein, partial [Rhodospirillales bacterium]|nr:sulfite exporter TauE/SafE family protein [Rhodospirillales bacterium]
SIIPPLAVGFVIGILSAIMGVGGGFVMVPLMIYILEMPTAVVIGTSLLQIIFVTANVTLLQAINTQTVDIVLMLALLLGGVVGAQFGVRFGTRLKPEHLRGMLALVVLSVCAKLLFDLVSTPIEPFSLGVAGD